jgi:hypothetical protein
MTKFMPLWTFVLVATTVVAWLETSIALNRELREALASRGAMPISYYPAGACSSLQAATRGKAIIGLPC